MARRPSKKVNLKDGYYIALKSHLNNHQAPILIRRNSKEEIKRLMESYSKTKSVSYYGQVKDSELVAE